MARKVAAALAATGLLAGCGGGGSAFDDTVSLQSKQDVVRELGNVSDFVGFGDGNVSAKSSHRPAHQRWLRVVRASGTAKSTTTENCSDGGTVDSDDGSKVRAFELFSGSRIVDFTTLVARDCAESDSFGDRFTTTGVIEFGYANADGYGYSTNGTNGDPLRFHQELTSGNGGPLTSDARVVLVEEYRPSGADQEVRSILQADYNDSTGKTAAVTVGNGFTDPIVKLEGDNRFRVDGPYRYRSSDCGGGQVRVETLSAITFNSNTGYPNGGQLQLSSGAAAATVTINLDGSATLQFSTGGSDTVSATQMQDLYDSGGDC